MGRFELIELKDFKNLLAEHQPILEDREKGLSGEVSEEMPELEHAIVSCIYAHTNAKKSAIDAIKTHGMGVVEKSVPLPSVGVVIGESGARLVAEAADHSLTLTDVEVDWMIDEFREFLDTIVHVVEHELKLRALVDELDDVRRKTNAIKHSLIPDILQQMHDIEVKIDEEELDSMVQLKFFEF